MSSNQYLRVGDQVKLSNDHSWSRDETNPTDARGYVESVGGSITVRWALRESTRTNTYNSRHNDLILLPTTVEADDEETRERFISYCDARGISLLVEDFDDHRVTLIPQDDEQVL